MVEVGALADKPDPQAKSGFKAAETPVHMVIEETKVTRTMLLWIF